VRLSLELPKGVQSVPLGLCVTNFLLGISMTTNGGVHLFTVFDDRCTDSLLLITCVELLLVGWVYGSNTFFDNLREMKVFVPQFLILPWKVKKCQLSFPAKPF